MKTLRLSMMLAVATAALLALHRPALAAAQTSEQLVQATLARLDTSFEKSKAAIIKIGESTVVKVNSLQAKNTRAATIIKTADSAKIKISKTSMSGKASLAKTAAATIKTLQKRGAEQELIDTLTARVDELGPQLHSVANECYDAINTALDD